jgi:hypothetical protein
MDKHMVFRKRYYSFNCIQEPNYSVILSGVVVIVLAIGPKVREFKPGWGQWIFKSDKNP